jgi:hypothetical protein
MDPYLNKLSNLFLYLPAFISSMPKIMKMSLQGTCKSIDKAVQKTFKRIEFCDSKSLNMR